MDLIWKTLPEVQIVVVPFSVGLLAKLVTEMAYFQATFSLYSLPD